MDFASIPVSCTVKSVRRMVAAYLEAETKHVTLVLPEPEQAKEKGRDGEIQLDCKTTLQAILELQGIVFISDS